MALFFYSLAQNEVGLENIMQLPAYRCSLPHFASEWKKAVIYPLLCVFKKGGQNYFWRGFLHQSGFGGDNGPMGFKRFSILWRKSQSDLCSSSWAPWSARVNYPSTAFNKKCFSHSLDIIQLFCVFLV